ncbi:transcriptional protein SWT1 isoform X2 [Cololabis saira]|uniref:transcriptional protein SWT1 isoform X2 n=1 Tax=Cololabis saira TaxID=129043 RepID=UPI002AD2F2D6|nr:transcriptional protein SWT1 isoform X2 [Cololabis saira]
MAKHSKKRRSKRLSSSSEEDEKVSKKQDDSHSYKHSKKKSKKHHERHEKHHKKSVKDDSRSTRLIKKAVYKQLKAQAAEEKAINDKEQCTNTRRVSVPSLRERCSSKEIKSASGKGTTISGSKTEGGSSKPFDNNNVALVLKTKEEALKDKLDQKSSQRSQSKSERQQRSPELEQKSSQRSQSKRQQKSPELDLTEQEDKSKSVKKLRSKSEEPSRNDNESSTIKSCEPTTSIFKDSLEQKRKELVQRKSLQVKEVMAKSSLFTDSKYTSASFTENSITSANRTTSESRSKELKSEPSTSENGSSSSSEKAKQLSAAQKQALSLKFVPFKFRIPKKVWPKPIRGNIVEKRDAISSNKDLKHETKPPDSGCLTIKAKPETVQEVPSCSDSIPNFPFEKQDKSSSVSVQLPPPDDPNSEPLNDQMQVVEELHLARSEKRLEVNVMTSYGELTCMDIDSPEEAPADSICRQLQQQVLILVLDTNILLSHLDYVKKIRSHGLGALGLHVVLIPWVVLQELDSLKKGRGLSGSVAHLATPAISYIYNALKNREQHLWGQSMQQAAESRSGLNTENNDDRVLQCCLQYQNMHPECALILCTKALLSGVRALCKSDLEAEVERSKRGLHNIQSIQAPLLPHVSPQLTSPASSRSCTQAQEQKHENTRLSVGTLEKDIKRLNERDEDEAKQSLSRCFVELEECLQEVLSEVLEVEMKAVYEDLWLEVVYIKPPWTLRDVLHCLKKHWIAVFGHIAPRRMLENVLSLITFFNSGESSDRHAVSLALQGAKELLKAFCASSNHAPRAITTLENIFNKLHPQQHVEGKSSACDVVMNDDDDEEEDKQPTSAQLSHQEVWAVFEDIWSNVYQLSLEVFKALRFDPHTMQAMLPLGDAPPPQDALACLHTLSSLVSQLLQAFSSVLSSDPGLGEAQTLLSIIHSSKIVNEVSRLTAKDVLDCFSQLDYREKLRVGGSQLVELKGALDGCVQAAGQHTACTMQH